MTQNLLTPEREKEIGELTRSIVKTIWEDISDRSGYDFEELDEETQIDIKSEWAIRIRNILEKDEAKKMRMDNQAIAFYRNDRNRLEERIDALEDENKKLRKKVAHLERAQKARDA